MCENLILSVYKAHQISIEKKKKKTPCEFFLQCFFKNVPFGYSCIILWKIILEVYVSAGLIFFNFYFSSLKINFTCLLRKAFLVFPCRRLLKNVIVSSIAVFVQNGYKLAAMVFFFLSSDFYHVPICTIAFEALDFCFIRLFSIWASQVRCSFIISLAI